MRTSAAECRGMHRSSYGPEHCTLVPGLEGRDLRSSHSGAATASGNRRSGSVNREAAPAMDVPPGWTKNPAAWAERLPIVALALLGAAISGYLALYQYNVVTHIWEPFFGSGSERVLRSRLRSSYPFRMQRSGCSPISQTPSPA